MPTTTPRPLLVVTASLDTHRPQQGVELALLAAKEEEPSSA